jgi:hypothetical protein
MENAQNLVAEELALERLLRPMGLVMKIEQLLCDDGVSVNKLANAYSKFSDKGKYTPNMLISIEPFIEAKPDAANARSYVINKIWAKKSEVTNILTPEIAQEYQRVEALKTLVANAHIAVNRNTQDLPADNLLAFKQGMQCMADLLGANQLRQQWTD